MGVSINGGTPIARGNWKSETKIDDLGVPPFKETPICRGSIGSFLVSAKSVRLIILPWVSSTVRRSSFPTGSQFCFCHGAEARCGRWFQDESLTFPSLWQGRSANGAQYAQCFPSLHAIMIGHDDDQSAHIFGIYSIRQPGTFGWLSALFDFSTKVYIYIFIMNFHNTWLFQPLGC